MEVHYGVHLHHWEFGQQETSIFPESWPDSLWPPEIALG